MLFLNTTGTFILMTFIIYDQTVSDASDTIRVLLLFILLSPRCKYCSMFIHVQSKSHHAGRKHLSVFITSIRKMSTQQTHAHAHRVLSTPQWRKPGAGLSAPPHHTHRNHSKLPPKPLSFVNAHAKCERRQALRVHTILGFKNVATCPYLTVIN